MSLIDVVVPVDGMSCDHCEEKIRRSLSSIEHVENVAVDRHSGQATLTYDSLWVEYGQLAGVIEDLSYSVPVKESVLPIKGMSCVSCSAHVENALRELPGVVDVKVSLADDSATVSHVETSASVDQFRLAISRVGYELVRTA